MRRQTPMARAIALVVGLSMAGHSVPADAAELKPKTVQAFNEYAAAVEARITRELAASSGFLGLDFGKPAEAQTVRRKVVAGEVHVTRLVARGDDAEEIRVPGGLINHWRGVIFVPGVTVDEAAFQATFAPQQ